MKRSAVRAAEHLKGWVSEVIDKYHETDVNPAQAKLVIWNEIQATLADIKPKHFANVLWLRVTVPTGDPEATRTMFEILNQGEVVSSRYLGPKGDDMDGIFYLTAVVKNVDTASEIVDCLTGEGFEVRDWSYGSNRR